MTSFQATAGFQTGPNPPQDSRMAYNEVGPGYFRTMKTAILAGLVLGAIALAITTRFLDRMLYGVSAFDPVRLAAITAILAMVAIMAGLFPSLRAASIDPILALRAE